MSAPDSLGAYLTFEARPGRADSERNCVSNIRPPDGLPHDAAAEILAALMTESFRLGLSGISQGHRGGAAGGRGVTPAGVGAPRSTCGGAGRDRVPAHHLGRARAHRVRRDDQLRRAGPTVEPAGLF